jgi:hypothetical protein
MAEELLAKTWLLIDAAGPLSTIGLVREGQWLGKSIRDGDFLAMLQPATEELLREEKLNLEDLAGAIYATGPGSTLGLRLAAMFIRSFMEMSQLNHWQCLEYQNLELALWSQHGSGCREAVAPWRRDRFHHVKLDCAEECRFEHSYISPMEAEEAEIPGFELGRRPPAFANSINWLPFPLDSVPLILASNTALLQPSEAPIPYSAEEPEFARWSPKRHTKP